MAPKITYLPAVAAVAVGALAVTSILAFFWWGPKADEFLGTADFEGNPIPPANILSPLGQTTYNGILTFSNVDRAMVGKLLPAGYVLAKNKSYFYQSKHPVALLFGDQTDGSQMILSKPVPITSIDRLHYTEMILGIPFVQKKGQSGWHTYIVRMYLDHQGAVTGGNVYGYAKQFACLDWTGKEVKIWRTPGVCPAGLVAAKDLLAGQFEFRGFWRDGKDALTQLDNFQDMVDIWTTRILGQTLLTTTCSYFEWDLDKARVAPAVTSYTFESPFRSDMTAWPQLGSLDNVYRGAAVIRGLRWRLANPFPC